MAVIIITDVVTHACEIGSVVAMRHMVLSTYSTELIISVIEQVRMTRSIMSTRPFLNAGESILITKSTLTNSRLPVANAQPNATTYTKRNRAASSVHAGELIGNGRDITGAIQHQ